MAMTRIKLVNILYENHGFNRTEAKVLVDCFFEQLCNSLAESESVKLSGFGSFYVQNKKERMGRNPKTGEDYRIAPRSVVRFRASNKLREKIDKNTQETPEVANEPFQFLT
jgi:integration host factor subunit alpha